MDETEKASAGRVSGLLGNKPLYNAVLEVLDRRSRSSGDPWPLAGLPPEGAVEMLERRSGPPTFLEAIIRQAGRPPMVVRNGAIVWEPPGELAVTRPQIESCAPLADSVGRVDFVNHDLSFGGTAWVLDAHGDDRYVVTNRHVALEVCRRLADERGVLAHSPWSGARFGLKVDFNEEPGASPRRLARGDLVEATWIADDLQSDVALLRIRSTDRVGLPDPLTLSDCEAKVGEVVALIGYPAWDSRNDPTAMGRYFRDLYDIKRFAPGAIMQSATQGVITHDCTSLGGNSGSPLIRVADRTVIGLHFAGNYGVGNSAVSRETLAELLRAKRLVSAARNGGASGEETRSDGRNTAASLAGRDGFDTRFLGDDVPETPWPRLSADHQKDLAEPSDATSDRPNELRYTNFGILFSTRLKLPLMTAVNIDGENAVRIKRGRDRWFYDLRIPEASQFSSHDYNHRGIDRGHMVRREDPNWGANATQANSDTFHLTNAAPQHSAFNRSSEHWLGLESYLLESTRTHGFRLSVFTGPVHHSDDPPLEEDGMTVPVEFWKLAIMKTKGGSPLSATAYLLTQGQFIRRMLTERSRNEIKEGFRLGEFKTFQIPVSDLTRSLGYDFSDYEVFDPLSVAATEREAAEAPFMREIRSSSDLTL